MPQTKRNKRVEIRFSDDEYNQLLQKKTCVHTAKFIRDCVLNNDNRTSKKIKRVADPNLIFELSKIGANINQIAKFCNQNSAIETEVSLQILSILNEIYYELKETIKNYDS